MIPFVLILLIIHRDRSLYTLTNYIFLKNKYGNITNAKTNNIEINKILDLEVNTPKVYLTFGETYKIKANITSIGTVNEKIIIFQKMKV